MIWQNLRGISWTFRSQACVIYERYIFNIAPQLSNKSWDDYSCCLLQTRCSVIVLGTSDQREYKIETDASVKPIQHQTKKVNQSTKEDIHTQLKDIENRDPVCLGK